MLPETREKIRLIEKSSSFAEVPAEALPKAYREDYYFVSYSHKDYKTVLKDILLFEEKGIHIWYDTAMHMGEDWEEIAEIALTRFGCKGVIFYLSEHSVSSPACNKEVDYVLKRDKPFFSINIPLPGREVESGSRMLEELSKGKAISQDLKDNFAKAFGDNVLYLSVFEPPEKKAAKIAEMKGEPLFLAEKYFISGQGHPVAIVTECRDAELIRADLSKKMLIPTNGKEESDDCPDEENADARTDKEKVEAEAETDSTEKDSEAYGVVTKLGDCLFTNCFRLETVKVSDELNGVGENCFRNCYALREFPVEMLDCIPNGAFQNCTSLPVSRVNADWVGENAFRNCRSITALTLNTDTIKSGAFSSCENLTSVRFLSELNECGAGAFASCKSLNTLSDLCSNSQTDEPTELGMQAFSSCTALKEVTFKGKWDYRYAVMAFFGCSSLSVAVLSLDCGIIPDSFMEGCSALTKVICRKKMPTHIGERAFAHCRNLKKIDLHRVAEVREKGMYETGLEELRLPSVKNIEKQAFAHILPLQKVFIGEKLQSIDGSAFDGDEALSELEILADDFSFTDFSGIQPKSVAGRSLDFLTEMVFRNGDNLQNLYVDEDVFTPDFRYFIHKAGFHLTKSDKKGYVLLTYTPGVPDTEGKDSHKNNPYRFYVGKDVGLTQENDYLLIFPDSCGYDDEKKEYYIAEGSIRYYASDIREITVRHL